MKEYLIKILRWILKELSVLTLKKYRPTIVGITGSVGKTSAKLAIAAVLQGSRSVRFTKENFNNELGVPLVILGSYGKIVGILFWPKVILASIRNLFKRINYPEILVLEYGVDRPGDMKYLLSIVKPNIGVITAIGDTPAHVEFFEGPEAVAREKGRLVESLLSMGHAVLNGDDRAVMELKERTRARLMTFGFDKNSSVRITNFESKDLARTFETIYFVQNISTKPIAANAAAGEEMGQKPTLVKQDISVEPVSGGITISELYSNREKYGNKVVKIKGQVTKYNAGIMDRNWIHLQDGTSSGEYFDLTVTTTDEVKVGDVVVFEGEITLNKDFGAGYSYEVIMEESKLIK